MFFREIDLFDFTSFFGLDFFQFFGPLCCCLKIDVGECLPSLVFRAQKCHFFILLKVELLLLPLICAKCIFTEKRLRGGYYLKKLKTTAIAATTSFYKCARCQISVKSQKHDKIQM